MKNVTKQKNKIQPPRSPKGETAGIVFKTLFLCLLLGAFAGLIFVGMWVDDVLADTPPLDMTNIGRGQSTLIFDQNEEPIFEFGEQRSEWVSFDEISQVMIDAILAIEDSRYFEHYGVDWSRTVAAVIYTAGNMISGGDSTQGGSTLTQQLINQTHLLLEDGTRDNEISRKVQEIYLAMEVEQLLSKEQIIEAYLNIAPFGGRIYGIQAASQFYFGVDADNLTLSQAATLAGIVQQPSILRPDSNAPLTQVRRNRVLELMVTHGFITQELSDLAAAEPITDLLVYRTVGVDDAHKYEPFINRVREEALERFGLEDLAGYQIFTTLDREAQGFVYNLMRNDGGFAWPTQEIQASVAMVANNGAIRALAHRDELNRRDIQMGFNPAVHGRHQPGSASKPIWAYGPAFELLSWGTGSMITDDLFGYDGGFPGAPVVWNHDNQFRGRDSVRNSMNRSWNVPAIMAYQAVVDTFGQDVMDKFVNDLGIPTPTEGFNQRYAIGGMAQGVSPLQMAGAYATFPNGGVFNEPYTIISIIAPDGTRIDGNEHRRTERVMSEGSAYMMNSILHTAVVGSWDRPDSGPTGAQAQVAGQWVAGKTGTTNFDETLRLQQQLPSNAVADAWFVGYNMEYTIAVWTGHERLDSGHFLTQENTQIPPRLFARIMTELGEPGWRMPVRPDTIREATIEWQSGTAEGEVCWPSPSTPSSAQHRELFHSHAMPTCQSNRFGGIAEAPSNLTATSAGGLTIDFTWDHESSGTTMSLREATEAYEHGMGISRGNAVMTEAMFNLPIRPGAARMIINEIQGGAGELEYVLVGTRANGSRHILGTTNDTYYTVTLSAIDAVLIQYFYVVARFVDSDNTTEPSNSVPNSGFIDSSYLEIELEDMRGWSLEQLEEWAEEHDISPHITRAYSDTVPEDHVISTNPNRVLRPGQTLQVVVSDGPAPTEAETTPTETMTGPGGLPQAPGVPGLPGARSSDTEDDDGVPNLFPF